MRRWLILLIACTAILTYGYAYFVRNAWPPHPWGGLGVVLVGTSVFLTPERADGSSPTRRRLAFLSIVVGMVLWLIDGLMMPSRP